MSNNTLPMIDTATKDRILQRHKNDLPWFRFEYTEFLDQPDVEGLDDDLLGAYWRIFTHLLKNIERRGFCFMHGRPMTDTEIADRWMGPYGTRAERIAKLERLREHYALEIIDGCTAAPRLLYWAWGLERAQEEADERARLRREAEERDAKTHAIRVANGQKGGLKSTALRAERAGNGEKAAEYFRKLEALGGRAFPGFTEPVASIDSTGPCDTLEGGLEPKRKPSPSQRQADPTVAWIQNNLPADKKLPAELAPKSEATVKPVSSHSSQPHLDLDPDLDLESSDSLSLGSASPLPDNFTLTEKQRREAVQRWVGKNRPDIDIDDEIELFHLRARAEGLLSCDWNATWNIWVQRALTMSPRPQTKRKKSGGYVEPWMKPAPPPHGPGFEHNCSGVGFGVGHVPHPYVCDTGCAHPREYFCAEAIAALGRLTSASKAKAEGGAQ